ncbi:MAG TPA: cysteine synthase family protein [Gemmatimonadaceae bacterium]|nr:cysteine synthase family protein [Gemmatimonadaceae bacterium]
MRFPGISASVLDVVGQTPLVALDRLAAGLPSRVLGKLEASNPGHSVKDRPALQIIEDAERTGVIKPGDTVIERTSGNMGTGLAIACALKGYKLVIVMSAGNSLERQKAIKALGAKIVLVPQVNGRPGQVTGDDLKAVERVTNELTVKLKAFRADQFKNRSSVKAHYTGTGPEIWKQTGGTVDVYVGVVGSSGSFTGIVRYLKKKNPRLRAVVVEPTAASILSGRRKKPGRHKLQGVGYMEIPQLYDPGLVDEFISIGDAEAMRTARKLARSEGILAGFTTGANVAAALRIARRSKTPLNIVTILTDSGLKYFSTDLFG